MVRRFLLSFVLVMAGFAAGMVLTARMRVATESRAENLAPPVIEGQAAPRSTSASPASPASPVVSIAGPGMADFSAVAGRAVKGVVNISSLQVVRMPNSPYASDPFFRYFFRDDDAFGSRDRRSLSLGSGVLI